MKLRRQTVEHAFGTPKCWIGSTHFLAKTLPNVRTEVSLHVLAYNLKRMMTYAKWLNSANDWAELAKLEANVTGTELVQD